MKILVTGSTGFIGRRYVARIVSGGVDEAVCVIRRSDGATPGTRSIVASSFDAAALDECIAREAPDAIVHLAAAGVAPTDRDAARLADVNAMMPAALVRAAHRAGTALVIVCGSSAEYAMQPGPRPIVEASALESSKLYGATKAAGGLLAVATGHALGVRVVALRLFNVFGAGEASHRLLPTIVSAAREGRPVPLSKGEQVRDFVEVGDACRAIETTLHGSTKDSVPSGHYNVCSGVGTRVADFARAVSDRLGADPSLLQFGALPLRADDLPWLVGDPTRFHRATGWTASPLAAAIDHAVVDETIGARRAPQLRTNDPARDAETMAPHGADR